MRLFPTFIAISTLAVGSIALAGGHADPAAQALSLRKGHMQLNGFNIGPLGQMVRGNMEYDAEVAARAANNLAALASIDQTGYWLEGTEAGAFEGSRAKAEIWSDMAGFDADNQDLAAATEALAAVAGDGLEAMQAAFGPVGEACGACHEAYRVPND